MPTLHNPTDQDLWCVPLHQIVRAHASVELTDEQAAQINTVTGIWHVTAAATRATVKRGGKRVEITTAPAMEKRG